MENAIHLLVLVIDVDKEDLVLKSEKISMRLDSDSLGDLQHLGSLPRLSFNAVLVFQWVRHFHIIEELDIHNMLLDALVDIKGLQPKEV